SLCFPTNNPYTMRSAAVCQAAPDAESNTIGQIAFPASTLSHTVHYSHWNGKIVTAFRSDGLIFLHLPDEQSSVSYPAYCIENVDPFDFVTALVLIRVL